MTRLFVAFLLGFALVWTLPAALRSATPLSLSDVQMGLGKLGIVQGRTFSTLYGTYQVDSVKVRPGSKPAPSSSSSAPHRNDLCSFRPSTRWLGAFRHLRRREAE